MKVVVSHPHAATVANATAAALERHGMLAAYFTGIAAVPGSGRARVVSALGGRWPVARNRILGGIGSDHLRSLTGTEMALRALSRAIARLPFDVAGAEAAYVAHDAAVALARWPRGTDAVYAYEDGARRTFARARRRDMLRLWDLPALHYATVEDLWRTEAARWPGAVGAAPRFEPPWKRRLKDDELALATHVFVASRFTRASLERAGADKPVAIVPYGFPVETFAPKVSAPSGRFTALVVGRHDLRKGTPYLLEAWKRADLNGARLRLIGAMGLTRSFVDRYAGTFEHVQHLPRAALAAEYAAADVVVFPTLGDGFGLVIEEAMACATPVITTPCGGGPECITDGVDGWIVPARDVDALVARLRACAADRDRTRAVGLAARARAERYTWTDAGNAIADAIGAVR